MKFQDLSPDHFGEIKIRQRYRKGSEPEPYFVAVDYGGNEFDLQELLKRCMGESPFTAEVEKMIGAWERGEYVGADTRVCPSQNEGEGSPQRSPEEFAEAVVDLAAITLKVKRYIRQFKTV